MIYYKLIRSYETLQSNILLNTKQNEHVNYVERFAQEEVERRDSKSARGTTPIPKIKSKNN